MRLVVLDFETYFADDFTLSKLSTEAYIRDPRFIAHGAAIKWSPSVDAKWYDEPELRHVLVEEDWSDVLLVCHHAHFDGLILTHHYGVKPRLWGCTLSMARLLLGNHLSVSLDNVRKHFNIPLKTTPYNLFKNKHWGEMTPEVRAQVAAGAEDEVESIWKIFHLLAQDFPQEEFEVVDTVIRMFTEPVLRGDIDLLARIWQDEEVGKANRATVLGIDPAEIQSADRFADLLREEGIEPETKQGKNGPIYAFAKTDQFMRDCLDHDLDRVRLLAEARIGEKSTIMQTRAETFGWMERRGSLPVYLNYSGAGTLRPSGGDGTNWLNLKRASPLRKAVKAPNGYLLAPIDASQIEYRCAQWLAGGTDAPALERIRNGQDPYIHTAIKFYKQTIYKPEKNDPRRAEMEAMRGLGKQGELMCIYGASGKQFKISAKNGLYGPSVDIPLDGDGSANEFVKLWREDNPHITARNTGYWQQCEQMLRVLHGGGTVEFGPMLIRNHKIYMPNGAMMNYDTIEWYRPPIEERDKYREFEWDGFWRVKTRQGWKKMWGSKLTQNICEAVSRVIVSQAMIRIVRKGYRVLNWPYDELLCLVPRDGQEDQHLQYLIGELKQPVSWLPGLPLDAEGHLDERYIK